MQTVLEALENNVNDGVLKEDVKLYAPESKLEMYKDKVNKILGGHIRKYIDAHIVMMPVDFYEKERRMWIGLAKEEKQNDRT